MKENTKKFWWLTVIIVIVGGIFYWYSFRPSIIKKNCYNEATERARSNYIPFGEKEKLNFDTYYKRCLEKNGL